MTAYRHNEWSQLVGAFVEVHKNHELFRTGFVDDAMPNASALWLAADEDHRRMIIEAGEGYDVWVESRELEGKHRYRMTASALHRGSGHR